MLVYIDGSEKTVRYLRFVLMLADKLGSKVTLLNIQEPRYTPSSKDAEIVGKDVLSRALESIRREKGCYQLKLDELILDKIVEVGNPSNKIIELSSTGKYDLITLSTSKERSRRLMFRSAIDAIGRKSMCSVLVVPNKSG